MNDFARTINQPANQLKVLQQQLKETGRWISAVFYGTIGNVLPYINGFVMAIKSLIQTFATFMGYELPNSSGQTGTILDSMEDSMGGISDGVNDVNGGLDKTNDKLDKAKKKTKEWKNYLASFDVANVIPDQSDDSDSEKDKNPDLGANYVDPRILAALEKMKYQFSDIRMKADEIRDAILSWVDNIGKIANENIFKPIKNSWNKYGAGILSDIKETKDNIVHILGGVFDVVKEKWKPFFQSVSDLFFSLMDTASLVTATITKLFRVVWDNGGKYLFDALWDLATAFLKLATSVNDNFVKPLITGIKNSIVPVVGKAVGVVLGLIGNLLKALSGIIGWIADCRPLVITLTSAFSGLFLTIKVAKFVELVNAMKGSHKVFKALTDILYDNSKLFKKCYDLWVKLQKSYTNSISSLKKFNEVLSDTKVWKTLTNGLSKAGNKMLEFGDTMIEGGGKVSSFAGIIIGKLGAALTWLAANPIVAVIAAIGLAIGAFVAFSSSQKDTKVNIEDCSDAVKKQEDEVNSLNDTMQRAKETYDDSMRTAEANANTVQKAMERLNTIAGKTKIIDIKDLPEAKVLVDKVNEALGTSYEITGNNLLVQKKTNDELNKEVQMMKEKAKEEAKYQLRVEYEEQILKAKQKVNELESERNGYLEDRKKYTSEISDIEKKMDNLSSYDLHKGKWQELNTTLEKAKDNLNKTNANFEETGKQIDKVKESSKNASDGLKELDKASEKASSSTKELTDELEKFYKEFGLSDKAGLAFEDLANNFVSNSDKMKKASGDERKKFELENANIIKDYANRAKEYNLNSSQIIEIAKKHGIALTEEELKNADKNYNNAKKAYEETKKLNKATLDAIVFALTDHNGIMDTETKKGYTDMLNALYQYGINVDEKNVKIYKSMFDILQKSGTNLTTEQKKQYTQFLGNLQQNGVTLTVEKAKQYRGYYDTYVSHGQSMNAEQRKQYGIFLSELVKAGIAIDSEQGKQYQKQFIESQKSGSKTGSEYITQFKKEVGGKNINGEVGGILGSAQKTANNNPLGITMNIPDGGIIGRNLMQSIKGGVNANPIDFAFKKIGSIGKIFGDVFSGGLKLIGFADGGFPDVGQLFIANENGPEMMGKMGNRNVVANNNQIVSGIEGGVERAMTKVLSNQQQYQKRGGDLYITIENKDGTTTEKVIKDYEKQMMFTGGKGGFKV